MIDQALPEGDGRNVVNVILVDFRGLDTLGEITVLAAAAIGTVALARAGRRPGRPAVAADGTVERRPPPVPLTRLVTIDVSVRIVFAAVMVGSLWLLFAGHNQPGGGFVGGIVAGAAVSLRYVAGGLAEVRRLSRGQPWMVLGAGLLIAVTTAIVPLLLGGAVLETGSVTLDLPLLGTVKLTSALVFDIGVYLVVIGLALMVFESFGDDTSVVPARRDGRPSSTSAVAPAHDAGRRSAVSVLMAFTAAVLFGIGTYLLLQRKLSRLIIGLGLIGHGANVVFVTATRRGDAAADRDRRPGRVRRPAAPVARADGHRDQLRHHGAAARPRLPQLAAHRRRRGRRRHRRPQRRPRRIGDTEVADAGDRRRTDGVAP